MAVIGIRVKIATYNINNIRKRLANLLAWLDAARPDVVCLQELKTADTDFPAQALAHAGYHAVWHGQRQWNGVAILARDAEPVLTRKALPGDDGSDGSRYIEAAVRGVLIASLYAPNGNPQPGPKFAAKIAWLGRLDAHARTLLGAPAPVVLAGDYNVVPTDADIYSTRSWATNALLHPQARKAYADILAQGWTDALRTAHPGAVPWTFWSYLRTSFERDAGMRIDHLLLNARAAALLRTAGVDRMVRGAPDASDHAPAWIDLRRSDTRPRRAAGS